MLYRKFNDEFDLSRLCFGGASLSGEAGGYGFGPITEKQAIELVNSAFDHGINFFDTAPIYGFFESEKRLGLSLKNKREKVKIISKSGVTWHSTKRVNMTNDPQIAVSMLDQSLKNLQTDYLDFYMVHWPDPKIDIRFTLEGLQREKEKDKIIYLGLCNTNQEELLKAKEVCEIELIQSEANYFYDQVNPLDYSGFKSSWGTFDKGILTGSVTTDRKFDTSDCRSWAPWWKKSNWKEKVNATQKLASFAKDSDHTLLEMALGYVLNILNIDSALCGIKNLDQLQSLLKAIEHLPKDDILNEGKAIIDEQIR